MVQVVLSDQFRKKAVKFLKRHRDLVPKYKKTLRMLEINPHHPSLRLHKQKGKFDEYYSVSLSMKYRVMLDFIITDDQVILIDIGGHELYE